VPLIAGAWLSRAKTNPRLDGSCIAASSTLPSFVSRGVSSKLFSRLEGTGVSGNWMTFASTKLSNFTGGMVANRIGGILAASMSEIVVGLL
jgi:hypothetical protein